MKKSLINETTMAAIARGLNKKGCGSLIIVYELGGGQPPQEENRHRSQHQPQSYRKARAGDGKSQGESEHTSIEIESFENRNDCSETLTRAKVKDLNMDLCRKTIECAEQVIEKGNIQETGRPFIGLFSDLTFFPGRPCLRISDTKSKNSQRFSTYRGGHTSTV
jgi:molecular chaperone DnaK (HSP70)